VARAAKAASVQAKPSVLVAQSLPFIAPVVKLRRRIPSRVLAALAGHVLLEHVLVTVPALRTLSRAVISALVVPDLLEHALARRLVTVDCSQLKPTSPLKHRLSASRPPDMN